MIQAVERVDFVSVLIELGDSPATVGETAGHDEMVTMFLPLAPNPVIGRFLTPSPTSACSTST